MNIWSQVNENELEYFVRSKLHVIKEFPDYLPHTQAVGRCIKMVTEVSMTLLLLNKRWIYSI